MEVLILSEVAPKPSPAQAFAVREEMLRSMLLHGEITRRELGDTVLLSGGAITQHTRWLKQRRLVRGTRHRVDTSFRPVERLSIDGGRGRCLAIAVSQGVVHGDLLGCDGRVLRSWSRRVEPFTQVALFAAIDGIGRDACESESASIDAAALMVSGHVTPGRGLVFDINGIEGAFEPSQPGQILPAFESIGSFSVWTDAACKARGYAGRLKRRDGVAYFEKQGSVFRLGNIEHGRVHYGEQGTASSLFHRNVASRGPACICGRSGCLTGLMRQPTRDRERIAAGIAAVFREIDARYIGLEWDEQSDWLPVLLEEQGVAAEPVTDGAELARSGLQALAAESALTRRLLASDQADRSRNSP